MRAVGRRSIWAMLATWDDTAMPDEQARAISDNRYDLLAELQSLPAQTPEGLRAKAKVLLLALQTDVPEMLEDTLETAGQPHDLLALSLIKDVLGRASA